jgi:hypothetical protein
VEGVLLISPEYGDSEHGSVYGQDLMRMGGEVVGFKGMSAGAAMQLTNEDFDKVTNEDFDKARQFVFDRSPSIVKLLDGSGV